MSALDGGTISEAGPGERVLVAGRPGTTDARPRVEVGPGVGATFDGDRWYAPLSVAAVDEDRETWSVGTKVGALRLATRAIREHEPEQVWLRGRGRLGAFRSRAGIGWLERRLAAVAREVDAPLVVWTGPTGDVVRGDRRRYDVVVDQ